MKDTSSVCSEMSLQIERCPDLKLNQVLSLQRYIVRIIFMVPLYALMSFLSLLMEENSVYFGSIRDW
jgi:hypothetical protein